MWKKKINKNSYFKNSNLEGNKTICRKRAARGELTHYHWWKNLEEMNLIAGKFWGKFCNIEGNFESLRGKNIEIIYKGNLPSCREILDRLPGNKYFFQAHYRNNSFLKSNLVQLFSPKVKLFRLIKSFSERGQLSEESAVNIMRIKISEFYSWMNLKGCDLS